MIAAGKYTYQVQWSEEDGEYVATVLEFPSLSWLAENPAEAEGGVRSLVEEVVADMLENGEVLPEPFGMKKVSGKFNVRIPRSLHRKLVEEAAREGVSLNTWVTAKLAAS